MSHRRSSHPKVDFHASSDGTHLVFDMPGVSQKDVEITVEEQWLTVIARRKSAESNGEWVHQEIRPFDFRREFTLSSSIDTKSNRGRTPRRRAESKIARWRKK